MRASETRGSRAVALWLACVAAMVLGMIVLGGVTRLTGSGLSIMEWAPLSGALPPLDHAEWDRLFNLYKQTSQYALVNTGMDLDGFKGIFWLEWGHRLLGRTIGLAFVVPLVVFAVRRSIERRLLPRLVLLFALGGLQGAIGWFMVASGWFPDSTAVSPYRLVLHLTMALLLYTALVWTALELWPSARKAPSPAWLRKLTGGCVALVALTIVAGGFVAGLHAGLDYNTFPLMNGALVPSAWDAMSPWWRNLTENVAAVQFDHRLLATCAASLTLVTAYLGLRAGLARRAMAALAVAVVVQYALGVSTLLWVVPVPLAAAHQFTAVLVLTAALVALHATRRTGD